MIHSIGSIEAMIMLLDAFRLALRYFTIKNKEKQKPIILTNSWVYSHVVFQILLVAPTHYLVLVLKINKSRRGDGLRKRSGMVANVSF